MFRRSGALATLWLLAIPTPAAAGSGATDAQIIQAQNHDELAKKFCAASADVDHVFVLPAALFVDSQELICDSGAYKLYRVVAANDADDFEYYIDPPFGKEHRLGCDGKAGRKVKVVAVNCRPE